MFELGLDWHFDRRHFYSRPSGCHLDHFYRRIADAQIPVLDGHAYSTLHRLGSEFLDVVHDSPGGLII